MSLCSHFVVADVLHVVTFRCIFAISSPTLFNLFSDCHSKCVDLPVDLIDHQHLLKAVKFTFSADAQVLTTVVHDLCDKMQSG